MAVQRKRRRRRRRSNKTAHARRKTPKIVIAAAIFLLAVMTNVFFPAFTRAIGDRVNSVFNYRGAFAALGEGISGERSFTEAIGEAWTVAFRGGRETPDAGAFSEAPPEPPPTEPAPPADTAALPPAADVDVNVDEDIGNDDETFGGDEVYTAGGEADGGTLN